MTKQCFINVNYIYNPIEKQRVSGYLRLFERISQDLGKRNK